MSAGVPPTEAETWRSIAGYEGFYEVSDLGRVRSLDREVVINHPTKGAFIQRRRGALRTLSIDRNGHPFIALSRDGEPPAQPVVRRLVLEAFVGPCPPDHVALPMDGDPSNCRLSNLSWHPGTEVLVRKVARGTVRAGQGHPSAKLTRADVEAIRADPTLSTAELAARYGMSVSRIYRIRSGRGWGFDSHPPKHRESSQP